MKKINSASLAIFLGAGWSCLALAEEPALQYDTCTECNPVSNVIYRQGVPAWYWPKGCRPLLAEYCPNASLMLTSGDQREARKKLIAMVLASVEGGKMFISENPNISMEIAGKNPWAALAFAGTYFASRPEEIPLAEKTTVWGMEMIDPQSLDAEKARQMIRSLHAGQRFADDPTQPGSVKIRTDMELRKTPGGAYLEIRISTANAENLEISRVLPDIRVQLVPAKNPPENPSGSYWDAVGWDY